MKMARVKNFKNVVFLKGKFINNQILAQYKHSPTRPKLHNKESIVYKRNT